MSILMVTVNTIAGEAVSINLEHVVSVSYAGQGPGKLSSDGPSDKVRLVNNTQISIPAGRFAAAIAELIEEYNLSAPNDSADRQHLFISSYYV